MRVNFVVERRTVERTGLTGAVLCASHPGPPSASKIAC